MHIQNSTNFSALLVSLIILVILVAASLATIGILGYTGFENTAVKPLPFSLDQYCVDGYYYNKYETANLTTLLQKNYIIVFSSSLLGLISLLALTSFVCCSRS